MSPVWTGPEEGCCLVFWMAGEKERERMLLEDSQVKTLPSSGRIGAHQLFIPYHLFGSTVTSIKSLPVFPLAQACYNFCCPRK